LPVTERNPAERSLAERLREQRALLAVIALAELIAIVMVSAISPHDHIDGEVYQLGAKAWVAGHDLYFNLPATQSGLQLPFIYPPFAAIVFSPLALVSKNTAISAIMIVTHLSLLATLYMVLSTSAFLRAHRGKVLLITAAVLPLATITEPVMETITYAQINIVLMAMAAVDCLWRTEGSRKLPYPRGLLIGLAAGVKLTPLVFLLFLLLRKDYRAILVSLATFVGTALLGLVLAFDDSRQYWLHEMFASGNVGFGNKYPGNASIYAGNQSLHSLLSKLQVPQPWLTIVFGVLAMVVLGLTVAGMAHALRQNEVPLAVTLNGVMGLLVSPISWTHHWVWAIPALVLLLGTAFSRRDWPLLLATTLAAGFFVMWPIWKVPQGDGKELHWNIFEHFVGNAYVYFGLVFLVYAAYGWWRARRGSRTMPEEANPEPTLTAPIG
jgi:alpha-1,2-mannosyltransferase